LLNLYQNVNYIVVVVQIEPYFGIVAIA